MRAAPWSLPRVSCQGAQGRDSSCKRAVPSQHMAHSLPASAPGAGNTPNTTTQLLGQKGTF